MKTSHLALAVLLAACGTAAGGTSWQRPPADAGDWFDGSNWSAGVPHSGAPAYINNGGAAVIGSGTGEAERLFFGYSFGSAGGSISVPVSAAPEYRLRLTSAAAISRRPNTQMRWLATAETSVLPAASAELKSSVARLMRACFVW